MRDVILRDCGGAGWLGILIMDGVEVHRTGKHWAMQADALMAVNRWSDKHLEHK